jgi:hypothetical protein
MSSRPVQTVVVIAALAAAWMSGSASAQSRRGDQGGDTGTTAVARPSSPAPAPVPATAPKPTADRGNSDGAGGGTAVGGDTGSRRPDRPGDPAVGRAVPRDTPRRPGDGGTVVIIPGGYYPWGYGGLGIGGIYGGYDPWYDPYGAGGPYLPAPSSSRDDNGAIRIKVTPRAAAVYADGYFVGHVDDFDGALQKLRLDAGPHRIELREQHYETLTIDVRIDSGQTITYRGEMKKIG